MSEHSNSPVLESILSRIGQPGLADLLDQKLSGTELNTLLLELLSRQTSRLSAGDLLRSYATNRFVKPADLPVLPLREMELAYLKIFANHGFEAIELSPVSSLGSCSVVGTASQHKILSALRGTEVLADATNALALYIAHLKKQGTWKPARGERRHFVVIQRHLRTPAVSHAGFTPHFKIAALVTAGYDTGNYTFEREALNEHIQVITELYQKHHRVSGLRFRLLCRDGYPYRTDLASKVRNHVVLHSTEAQVEIIEQPQKDNAYYKGIQYKVDIDHHGRTWEIGDGGFVNWTQLLLENRKERMFTTGLGFEFMYRIENNLL